MGLNQSSERACVSHHLLAFQTLAVGVRRFDCRTGSAERLDLTGLYPTTSLPQEGTKILLCLRLWKLVLKTGPCSHLDSQDHFQTRCFPPGVAQGVISFPAAEAEQPLQLPRLSLLGWWSRACKERP